MNDLVWASHILQWILIRIQRKHKFRRIPSIVLGLINPTVHNLADKEIVHVVEAVVA
jgi:hypothetical protein